MTRVVSFQIEENYQKVGLYTHDDFTAHVHSLTKGEAEWLRDQIIQLVQERGK